MSIKFSEGLRKALDDVAKRVRRYPVRSCSECYGKGTARYETYDGGQDRTFEEETCRSCNGKGTIGGGQPGLELWFQSVEERDAFKAKILKMRGIKWTDEAPGVLESQSNPPWKG